MTTIITPAPAYQKPSGRLYLGTHQSNLLDGDITLVELDTISSGFTDGIEDTNLHRITPGAAGFYHITGMVTFTNIVADRRYRACIFISDTTWLNINNAWPMGGTLLGLPVFGLVKLTASDYIELCAISNSGDDTVDIYARQDYTFLSAQRVR